MGQPRWEQSCQTERGPPATLAPQLRHPPLELWDPRPVLERSTHSAEHHDPPTEHHDLPPATSGQITSSGQAEPGHHLPVLVFYMVLTTRAAISRSHGIKQPPDAPTEYPTARQAFRVPTEQTHEQQCPIKGFREAEGQAVDMEKRIKQKARKGISFERGNGEGQEKSLRKTKEQQSHEEKLRLAVAAGREGCGDV